MTLPFEYQNPTLQFERFMVDARDCAGLPTTNMAWNMVVGAKKRSSLAYERGLVSLPPVLVACLRFHAGGPRATCMGAFHKPATTGVLPEVSCTNKLKQR